MQSARWRPDMAGITANWQLVRSRIELYSVAKLDVSPTLNEDPVTVPIADIRINTREFNPDT
jgi:hypothetical protein